MAEKNYIKVNLPPEMYTGVYDEKKIITRANTFSNSNLILHVNHG